MTAEPADEQARSFLNLEATKDPLRWRLKVGPRLCNLSGVLFGGAALGAGIEALQSGTERPVVWATAQYLTFAPVGSELDLEVGC